MEGFRKINTFISLGGLSPESVNLVVNLKFMNEESSMFMNEILPANFEISEKVTRLLSYSLPLFFIYKK